MRILLVDDHEMFAQSVKILLSTHHDISIATCGRDALTQTANSKPHIVLLDLSLPDIDGLTVLKVIRALPHPPPVLLLSGTDSMNCMSEAYRLGAAGYLHKSLPAESLVQAIHRVTSGETVWPEMQSNTITNPKKDANNTQFDKFNRLVVEELGITKRQLDVLHLLVEGNSNKSIANTLCIAESTVKTHIKVIFSILDVHNRVSCQNKAIELGLISKS